MDVPIIVGCSKRKQSKPAPAADMYQSAYFKVMLTWARSITAEDRILILSAKYGLIPTDQIIVPYHAIIGTPKGFARPKTPVIWERPVTLGKLADQINRYQLRGRVITLAGKDYYEALRLASSGSLWPYNPFFPVIDRNGGDHRQGYQAQVAKAHLGRVP